MLAFIALLGLLKASGLYIFMKVEDDKENVSILYKNNEIYVERGPPKMEPYASDLLSVIRGYKLKEETVPSVSPMAVPEGGTIPEISSTSVHPDAIYNLTALVAEDPVLRAKFAAGCKWVELPTDARDHLGDQNAALKLQKLIGSPSYYISQKSLKSCKVEEFKTSYNKWYIAHFLFKWSRQRAGTFPYQTPDCEASCGFEGIWSAFVKMVIRWNPDPSNFIRMVFPEPITTESESTEAPTNARIVAEPFLRLQRGDGSDLMEDLKLLGRKFIDPPKYLLIAAIEAVDKTNPNTKYQAISSEYWPEDLDLTSMAVDGEMNPITEPKAYTYSVDSFLQYDSQFHDVRLSDSRSVHPDDRIFAAVYVNYNARIPEKKGTKPKGGSNFWYYLIGGIVVVAPVSYAVYYFINKKKQSTVEI